MPGRWLLRTHFCLFYQINEGITSYLLDMIINHTFYFLAYYIYILIIYILLINQPEKSVERVIKEEIRAGDGTRTRDSLLGRQIVT